LEVCGPGTVGEAVLKMLAESGHHFSHLTENETLTVVITFRGGEEPQRPKAHDPAQAPPQKPATSSTSTSSATVEKKTEPSSARHYELLGDLHLKQGRAQEAVSAYAKAVELDPEPKRAAVLNRKLAQAYLALEPTDAHLKAAEERLKAAQAALEKGKKAEAVAQQQAQPPVAPAATL